MTISKLFRRSLSGLLLVACAVAMSTPRSVNEAAEALTHRDKADDPPPIPQFDFTESKAYLVLSAVDGDTISIVRNDAIEKIELIGIDAPEKDDPAARGSEFFGEEAHRFLNNALKAESVYLLFEPGQDGNNDGQTKAHVFRAPDGLWLNLEVVRQGYGQVGSNELAEQTELFMAYQRRAKDAQKGLWNPKDRMRWEQDQQRQSPQPAPTTSQPRKPAPRTAPPTQKEKKDPKPPSATVYITKTGSKYHRGSCSYLRSSRISISLEDAKRSYSPCSRCRPPG